MQLVRNGVGIDVEYDGSERFGVEAISLLCYGIDKSFCLVKAPILCIKFEE